MNSDFVAATIPKRIEYWKSITSDQYVLNIVRGLNIELDKPYVNRNTVPCHLNSDDKLCISAEVESLAQIGVIERSVHEAEEVISPVFLVKKSDGSFREMSLKQLSVNSIGCQMALN